MLVALVDPLRSMKPSVVWPASMVGLLVGLSLVLIGSVLVAVAAAGLGFSKVQPRSLLLVAVVDLPVHRISSRALGEMRDWPAITEHNCQIRVLADQAERLEPLSHLDFRVLCSQTLMQHLEMLVAAATVELAQAVRIMALVAAVAATLAAVAAHIRAQMLAHQAAVVVEATSSHQVALPLLHLAPRTARYPFSTPTGVWEPANPDQKMATRGRHAVRVGRKSPRFDLDPKVWVVSSLVPDESWVSHLCQGLPRRRRVSDKSLVS
jgi:hypothetical protein